MPRTALQEMDAAVVVHAQKLRWAQHADGYSPSLIPAMGAVYGYALIGEVRHAGIFFLEGDPGLGKSLL
jgi:hypothetical protein